MARPKPDIDATRDAILNLAEAQLIQSNGRRLVLSDIAHSLGMSQPYIYGFFATKADLVRALAQRWFALVEAEGNKIVQSNLPPDAKLRAYIHAIYACKRAAYIENPQLFAAYLELAKQHMDIVKQHTGVLHTQLENCVACVVSADFAEQATQIVEDATVLFRNPAMILANDGKVESKRIDQVLDCVLAHLTHQ